MLLISQLAAAMCQRSCLNRGFVDFCFVLRETTHVKLCRSSSRIWLRQELAWNCFAPLLQLLPSVPFHLALRYLTATVILDQDGLDLKS